MLRIHANYSRVTIAFHLFPSSFCFSIFHLIQANSTDSLVPNLEWPRTPFRTLISNIQYKHPCFILPALQTLPPAQNIRTKFPFP